MPAQRRRQFSIINHYERLLMFRKFLCLFPAVLTLLALPLFGLPLALRAQAKRAMELEDMFRVQRVSDPHISPDGKTIAYVVSVVDKPANRTNSDIWLVPAKGGAAKQLTNSPKHDRHPLWS